MSNGIARYLIDFDLEKKRETGRPEQGKPSQVPPSPTDIADRIRKAEAAAREEALTEAARKLEQSLAIERAGFTERLAVERTKWNDEEARALTAQFALAVQVMEQGLADCVARILTPFLADRLRQTIVEELLKTLGKLASDKQNVAFTIRGPDDMLSAIESALGPDNGRFTYVADTSVDVRVSVNDTAVETQLGAWSARLSEAIQLS